MPVYTPKDLKRFFPWKNVAEYHSVLTCAKRQRKGKRKWEKHPDRNRERDVGDL